MKTRFERGDRRRRMQMVGRNDRNGVDTFVGGQRLFLRHHRFERRMDALLLQAEHLAGADIPSGVRAECACHQPPVAVKRRGHPVDRADQRAFTAADHAEFERGADHQRQSCAGERPRIDRIASRPTPLEAKSSNGRSVRRMM